MKTAIRGYGASSVEKPVATPSGVALGRPGSSHPSLGRHLWRRQTESRKWGLCKLIALRHCWHPCLQASSDWEHVSGHLILESRVSYTPALDPEMIRQFCLDITYCLRASKSSRLGARIGCYGTVAKEGFGAS